MFACYLVLVWSCGSIGRPLESLESQIPAQIDLGCVFFYFLSVVARNSMQHVPQRDRTSRTGTTAQEERQDRDPAHLDHGECVEGGAE